VRDYVVERRWKGIEFSDLGIVEDGSEEAAYELTHPFIALEKTNQWIKEGDLFAVPLEDKHWAIALAAAKGEGSWCLGHFFRDRFRRVPSLEQARSAAQLGNAYLISRFRSLGITMGGWRYLGGLPEFRKEPWMWLEFYSEFGKRVHTIDPVTLIDVASRPAKGARDLKLPPYIVAEHWFLEHWLTYHLGLL
jgi:hypothetical protein